MKKPIKILFCSSSGGHYWNILQLKKLAKKYPSFVVTEKTDFNDDCICDKKYLFPMLNRKHFTSYLKIPFIVIKSIFILIKERPTHIISTGAFAVFPLLLLGKIMGKKIIFLETYARVNTPSFVGKLTYRFADLFFVQYKSMLEVYPNARVGAVL